MIRTELVADGVIGKVEVMNIRSLWRFRHIDRVEPLRVFGLERIERVGPQTFICYGVAQT